MDPRTTRPVPYRPGLIQTRSDPIQVRKQQKSHFLTYFLTRADKTREGGRGAALASVGGAVL